ncbi:hypothetical protein C0J52_23930 [Blattella germanica]|nr:hypothetical protein C0J52_23930 [Blattella germanica]
MFIFSYYLFQCGESIQNEDFHLPKIVQQNKEINQSFYIPKKQSTLKRKSCAPSAITSLPLINNPLKDRKCTTSNSFLHLPQLVTKLNSARVSGCSTLKSMQCGGAKLATIQELPLIKLATELQVI